MSLHQSPPGRGEGSKSPHFIHIKTAHGERWNAYAAGPCMWFDCHASGRSKPCLHAVTGGALPCPICSPLKPVEKLGYQPLYRESDGRPGFVVLHECAAEPVLHLKKHRRVIVGREDDQADGVFVVLHPNEEPRMHTTLAWKQNDIDLTESLLRVWKVPELAAWYNATRAASDSPVSLAETPTSRTLTGIADALAHQASVSEDNADRAAKSEAWVRRMKAEAATKPPVANGSHKKKKDESE